MTLAIIYSRASAGIAAPLVTVEVHISRGLPGLHIVGLPEAAVKESKDRVRSALINTGFEFPIKRITINLAPADLPKEGGRFDLPIALGILAASNQLPKTKLDHYEFTGELALSGELRSVRGVLPMVLSAHQLNRQLIVPAANANEAALVNDTSVLSAKHLLEVCAYLQGKAELPLCELSGLGLPAPALDLIDVKGQPHAKRALEIAASGRHSLLLIGPPGTGKTMLASRLPSILPPIDDYAALEVAAIASVSKGGFDVSQWKVIPFRSPHHTSSSAALVGGGRPPKPGEISLAHRGVLFLDELPEFSRQVLECLREPLEAGCITISRAASQAVFPAQFQFIAAMNPCPCGYAGSREDHCDCTREQVRRYRAKISGPLLDRIDMQVEVPRLSPAMLALSVEQLGENSEVVRKRVCQARYQQHLRQAKYNDALTVAELTQYALLEEEAQRLLYQVMEKFNLSARIYHKIIKVALTIADLEMANSIKFEHVSEALTYRCWDKSHHSSHGSGSGGFFSSGFVFFASITSSKTHNAKPDQGSKKKIFTHNNFPFKK